MKNKRADLQLSPGLTGYRGKDAEPPDDNIQSYFLTRSLSIPSADSPSPTSPEADKNKLQPPIQHAVEPVSMGSYASGTSKAKYIADWNEQATLMSSSWTADKPETRYPVDPPRPPKQDYEWVWFPEGYWAERPIIILNPSHAPQPTSDTSLRPPARQKWWSRTPSPARTSNKTTVSSTTRKPSSTGDDRRLSDSNKSNRSLQLGGFTFIKRKSSSENEQEEKPLGLYCRTKKGIREILLERSKLVHSLCSCLLIALC